jgi:hypothetical protein
VALVMSMKRHFKVSNLHANSFSTFCALKNDLDEVAEVMIQVGEWFWDLIICFLEVLKFDFCEFDKAMI